MLFRSYNWTIRHRLRLLYRQLKDLERGLERDHSASGLAMLHHELDRIDRMAQRIKFPLAYSDEIYDLRGHVDLVRHRLAAREQAAADAR